jgi:bifunctional DNA-binding transcriptional regulator/antitoxin component of YhaV-PrlF toxin-antitoxin module
MPSSAIDPILPFKKRTRESEKFRPLPLYTFFGRKTEVDVMTIFKARIDRENHLYIPKEIREQLGNENVELLSLYKATVIYPKGANPGDIIKSLRLMIENLKLFARSARGGGS